MVFFLNCTIAKLVSQFVSLQDKNKRYSVSKLSIAYFLLLHPVWQLPYVSSFHTVLLEATLRVLSFSLDEYKKIY